MKTLSLVMIPAISGFIFMFFQPFQKGALKPTEIPTSIVCTDCNKGHYIETYQNILVASDKGVFPIANAKHLKCSHCRVVLPDFELPSFQSQKYGKN
jgi:hypothetical protein